MTFKTRPTREQTQIEHEFWMANKDLWQALNGFELGVDFEQVSVYGAMKMYIVLTPKTTIKDIEAAWHIIAKWRERLEQLQGKLNAPMGGGKYETWEVLRILHDDQNMKYPEIAGWLNKGLAELIVNGHWWRAETLMIQLGYSEEAAHERVMYALEDIADGKNAFLPNEPITTDMVRKRMRTWRRTRPEVQPIGFEKPEELFDHWRV